MPAPSVIADLVERFEQQGDAYKSGQYNEAQLRKEFVDPMFKALGWDMENISGYAEAYKDVIHEDAIRIGGAIKELDDIISHTRPAGTRFARGAILARSCWFIGTTPVTRWSSLLWMARPSP